MTSVLRGLWSEAWESDIRQSIMGHITTHTENQIWDIMQFDVYDATQEKFRMHISGEINTTDVTHGFFVGAEVEELND